MMNEDFQPQIGMRLKYDIGLEMHEYCMIYDIISLPVPKDPKNLDEGFIYTLHLVLKADDPEANKITYTNGDLVLAIVPITDGNLYPITEGDEDDDIFDIPDTVLTPEELAEMNAP